jgi:hypothetical protein
MEQLTLVAVVAVAQTGASTMLVPTVAQEL